MFKSKDRRTLDERLDRIGRELLHCAALSDAEAEDAASSPFLYARVRARVAAEQKRREAGERWLSLAVVARRAVPAMALSAAIAFSIFWFGGGSVPFEQSFDDDILYAANDAGVEHVVFADRDTLSNDETLVTIMSGYEPEASR